MGENLTTMEFLEKTHDGVYEFQYQMMKDAVFDFFLWGLKTDNMNAVELYGEMLKLYRKHDSKFMRAAKDER